MGQFSPKVVPYRAFVMPSFDITLEPDFVELRNAVEQSNKEIGTRFDFKGSSAKVELIDNGPKGRELMVGVDSELGRKLQQLIKQSRLKVNAAIQGDSVRITGAKRDDLQMAIALVRREITDVPLKFGNPRE
jgi:uncharacterized protein YajQ (UPF0234 family)